MTIEQKIDRSIAQGKYIVIVLVAIAVIFSVIAWNDYRKTKQLLSQNTTK